MNRINFTANLIKHTQIPKRIDDDKYAPADVSIVELDKNDKRDVKALYNASVLWNEQGAKYSSNIYHEAVKGYEYDDVDCEHYLALTEQNSDFKNLQSDKILGLMLFSASKYDADQITWLQVRPNTNSKQTWKREYKGVGAAMINLLKQINYNKPINVVSASDAVDFYKKQGFTNCEDDIPSSLYWWEG